MLVVIRFSVRSEEEITFLADAEKALDTLARCPGYVDSQLGRSTDDPGRWVIVMRWENVGVYRRALNGYDVRISAVPLLARAVDEPTAFEVIHGAGATEPNRAQPRGTDPASLGPS